MYNWLECLQNVRSKLEPVELFGEILSELMNRAEVGVTELAQALFVEPATVSHWRHGRRLPSAEMLYPISQALDLDENETLILVNAYRGNQALTTLCEYIKGTEQSLQRADSTLRPDQKESKAQDVERVVRSIIGPVDDDM